ncbi:MAG TPA: hydroxymethylglutaryl-CoA lyase [Actinomycetota bacterium]|nr:hydroxymethylglutaryl-CoA lyase [Actinomycetota bacterium]
MSTSSHPDLPGSVAIVEVGPRDGLQNQPQIVSAVAKKEFIDSLADAGLKRIEATSFVHPKWVPQLSDASEVMASIERKPGVVYSALVPNLEGLERAMGAGADEVAVFASATESFSEKNLGRSRQDSLEMFRPVLEKAAEASLPVRGYVSMVLGDPWEGEVVSSEVVRMAEALLELGCTEVSLGDTIGVGTPGSVERLLHAIFAAGIGADAIAVHFHDTYGQALVNVLTSMRMGITTVDSSAGGLGGCPFAQSATGNLATEDLVWMLDGMGVETGVDVRKVAKASSRISSELGIEPPSRVARAIQK